MYYYCRHCDLYIYPKNHIKYSDHSFNTGHLEKNGCPTEKNSFPLYIVEEGKNNEKIMYLLVGNEKFFVIPRQDCSPQ
jgi:hypothetical protein